MNGAEQVNRAILNTWVVILLLLMSNLIEDQI